MATFSNGDTYDGQFVAGVPEGEGKRIWADGRTYQGTWQNGKRQGNGVITLANGNQYEGWFRANEMHGKGQCISEQRATTCTFFNGQRID